MRNDIRQFHEFNPDRIKAVGRGLVLICRRATPRKVGSIIVPDTSRQVNRHDVADVIAVGSDIDDVKRGDTLVLPDSFETAAKVSWEGMTYSFVTLATLKDLGVVDP
jgi:hypothetical protein